jgi:hypothetical protein
LLPGLAYAEWLKRFKIDDMDKSDRAKRVTELEEELAAALERIQKLESALEAAGVQLEGAEPGATDEAEEEAEAAQPANPKLAWTGDERQGFVARGLVGGTPVAYTVTPVNIGGRVHFEMKIVTDYRIFDFAQPVRQLADSYGFSLTYDVKGKHRRFDPVPHSAEAKAQCEADYAQHVSLPNRPPIFRRRKI